MDEKLNKTSSDVEERNFNAKRFFFKYLKYWYLFLISLSLFLAGAKYYNWYAKPIYQSSCRIIIKDENTSNTAENLLKDLMITKETGTLRMKFRF